MKLTKEQKRKVKQFLNIWKQSTKNGRTEDNEDLIFWFYEEMAKTGEGIVVVEVLKEIVPLEEDQEGTLRWLLKICNIIPVSEEATIYEQYCKLINNEHWDMVDPIEWIEEELSMRSRKLLAPIRLNPDHPKEKLINDLHHLLEKEGLIKHPFEDFKDHFEQDQTDLQKIRWRASQILIIVFVEELFRKQIITNDHRYKMIATHFVNRAEKPFKPKQLSTAFDLKGKKTRGRDAIDSIITHLSTLIQ